MNTNRSYSYAADIMRATAGIAVVTIHIVTEFVNYPAIFMTPSWWFANSIDSSIRAAVPIFIMLSGYLLLDTSRTYSLIEFIKKRVLRIGIPLVFWPILYYVWKLFSTTTEFTLVRFLNDFVSLSMYYHLYFLYVIAGLYLITPLLRSYLHSATRDVQTYILVLTGVFSLLLTLSKYFLSVGPNMGNIFLIFIPYVFYYLAGDYLRNSTVTRKQWKLLGLFYGIVTLITAVLTLWHMQYVHWDSQMSLSKANYNRYFYDYFSITIIPLSLTAFILLKNVADVFPVVANSHVKKIVLLLSKTAFGIYLIHPFLLDAGNKYFLLQLNTLAPLWIIIIFKTCIIFLTAYVLVSLGRRTPILKLLFE